MINADCRTDAAADNPGPSAALFNLFTGELASGKSDGRPVLRLESGSQSPAPPPTSKLVCRTAPHAFGGAGLEDVLRGCRKRVFGVEGAQWQGKSLLQAYLPVKRAVTPGASNQIQNHQEKPPGPGLGKRSPQPAADCSSRPESGRRRPEACESLSDFLGKSVKKQHLLEVERGSEKVLSKYRPVCARKTGREQVCAVGLEELLRSRNKRPSEPDQRSVAADEPRTTPSGAQTPAELAGTPP